MKHAILLTSLLITVLLSSCASNTNPQPRQACAHAPAGQYCVQSGDTLTRLSQRFSVSVTDLKRWNQLSSETIHVGDKLSIREPFNNGKISVGNNKHSVNAFRLQMPVDGKIIIPYSNQNKGIDIAANRGEFVHAASDGVVIYSGNNIAQYGKMVLLRHSATTITAYANNENILVPMNARVKAGQIIAEVGSSGRRDGKTALHFELRVNGKPTNPMNYFR